MNIEYKEVKECINMLYDKKSKDEVRTEEEIACK